MNKISKKVRTITAFLSLACLALAYQNCGVHTGSSFNINLGNTTGGGTINNTIQATNKLALGYQHTCAINASGGVECWGAGNSGQLGYGAYASYSLSPVTVINLPAPATKITTGSYTTGNSIETGFTCALLTNGAVYCWGDDTYAQLGNSVKNTNTAAPVLASVEHNFVYDIATSAGSTCVVLQSGIVQCWGQNDSGELGNGTTASPSLTATTVVGITNAVKISAGNYHFCATLSTGAMSCWGYGFSGQLGNQTNTTAQATPVAVTGMSTAQKGVGGGINSCALLSTGTASCWGDNTYGQLGNGTSTLTVSILPVINISGITDLSIGYGSACALVNGAVYCWGNNSVGNLGDNNYTTTSVPTPVSGLTTAIAIGSGYFHSCAFLSSGGIECWGYDYFGQLGSGKLNVTSAVPVTVVGF